MRLEYALRLVCDYAEDQVLELWDERDIDFDKRVKELQTAVDLLTKHITPKKEQLS
jgi:hypothetical protein